MDLRLVQSKSKSVTTANAESNSRDDGDKEVFSTLEKTPSNLKQVVIDIETLVTELSKQKELKEEPPESNLYKEREHRGTQTNHRLIPRTISRFYGNRRRSNSSVPDILNERSEIRECLNILFFIILGCIAFAVFFVVQKFTPKSHLIAALITLGSCIFLVFIFIFMTILLKTFNTL
ncbi:hypothetical protein CDAR_531221 [Caerostris darwini]|uniref:Uncharacterized protein n=1 Tax=Caerostris darwini TaxID=1538125 RepID=A0AAV4TZI2_9ARAC|nr:hypothetical protein CDAR_531221 [Caerostris darwini]